MKRHKVTQLTLKEFSAVRRPAQAGATIDLTKSDTRLVLIEKSGPFTADVHVPTCKGCQKPMKKDDSYCAACGAMQKADTTHTPSETQMNELEKAKADLAAALAKGEALQAQLTASQAYGLLSDVEKGHYGRLGAEAQAKFLKMSPSERAEETKPVYTSEATGQVFTKADDGKLIEMAKSFDSERKSWRSELEKAKEAGYAARVHKELGHLPGTLEERTALLKAVDGIADEKLREGALKALAKADEIRSGAFQRQGAGQTRLVKSGGAEDRMQQAVEKHATENKVSMDKAWDSFMATEEGAQLYAEVEAEKAEAGREARRN